MFAVKAEILQSLRSFRMTGFSSSSSERKDPLFLKYGTGFSLQFLFLLSKR